MKKFIVLIFAFAGSSPWLYAQSDSLVVSVAPERKSIDNISSSATNKAPLLIIYYNEDVYTAKDKTAGISGTLHPELLERVDLVNPEEAVSKFGKDAENGVILVTIKGGFLLEIENLTKVDSLSVD